jgi:nucleolin
VRSAISSAAETASTYASDAESSLSQRFGKAENAVADGAAAAASAVGFGRRDGFRERENRAPRDVKPTNTIYVGNLLFELTKDELKAEFQSFGNIGNVTIATDARGLSKG